MLFPFFVNPGNKGFRFRSEAKLSAFLGKLDQDYAQYAAVLWQTGIRTSRQLSDASKHILLSAGLRELHVADIKARASGTGGAEVGHMGLDETKMLAAVAKDQMKKAHSVRLSNLEPSQWDHIRMTAGLRLKP